MAAYLAYKGELTYAAVLLGLILPQMFFQAKYLLKDPIEYDVKYQVRLQGRLEEREDRRHPRITAIKTSVFGPPTGARREISASE